MCPLLTGKRKADHHILPLTPSVDKPLKDAEDFPPALCYSDLRPHFIQKVHHPQGLQLHPQVQINKSPPVLRGHVRKLEQPVNMFTSA